MPGNFKRIEGYTRKELQLLWYLKRHNGYVELEPGERSLINKIANEIEVTPGSLTHILRGLERQSILLRSYKGGVKGKMGEGYIPLVRVELVDPNMKLPPLPALSPGFIMERENEEEYIRTNGDVEGTDPTPEAVILALLNRNDELAARILELEGQVNKLQDIVEEQANKLTQASERSRNRKYPEHLTGRIQDALTPEQWERLRHGR